MRQTIAPAWPESFYITNLSGPVGRYGALFPFAYDEAAARALGSGARPLVHLWRHPRAFVIGLRDRRLPHAERAIRWLRSIGYDTVVRNSGGAAVPLDDGVVNLSVILPNPEGNIDFRNDFERITGLLGEVLAPWKADIAVGEIVGSYCPGDYDVSIEGRKFCGIAQRRQAAGFAVQAFVVAEGSGAERARLVRRFYELAAGGAVPGRDYPQVDDEKTASLAELVDFPSADALERLVVSRLEAWGGRVLPPEAPELGVSEQTVLPVLAQLKNRYDPVD